jgi:uncharacterized coiled-coil protein SlyX
MEMEMVESVSKRFLVDGPFEGCSTLQDKTLRIAIKQEDPKAAPKPVYVPYFRILNEEQFKASQKRLSEIFQKLGAIAGVLQTLHGEWHARACDSIHQVKDLKLGTPEKLCEVLDDGRQRPTDQELPKRLISYARAMDVSSRSIDAHWCGLMEYYAEALLVSRRLRESVEICWVLADRGCKPGAEDEGEIPMGDGLGLREATWRGATAPDATLHKPLGERIDALEMRLTHQGDTIETLNQTIAAQRRHQDDTIETLNQTITAQRQQIDALTQQVRQRPTRKRRAAK